MDKYQNKYRIPSTRLQRWDYRWAGSYFITICTQNMEHHFGEIKDGKMQLSHVGVIADILWHQIPHHHQNVELGAFVVMPNHIHGILIITQNGRDGGKDGGNPDGNDNDVAFANVGIDDGNAGNDDNVGNVDYVGNGVNVDNVNIVGNVGNVGNVNTVEKGHALSLQFHETHDEFHETHDEFHETHDEFHDSHDEFHDAPHDEFRDSHHDFHHESHHVPHDNSHVTSPDVFHDDFPGATPTPQSEQPKTIGQQRFQNIGKNSISSMVGSYKSAVTRHSRRLGFQIQWQSLFYDRIVRDDNAYQTISDYIINNPKQWEKDKFFKPE